MTAGYLAAGTSTESIERNVRAEAEENAAAAAAKKPAIKCWTRKRDLPYYINLPGGRKIQAYRWQHIVVYCFRGGKTYKVKQDKGYNAAMNPLLTYKGSKSVHVNKTPNFFYRQRQATYQGCIAGVCITTHPTHGARYMNNGKTKTYVYKTR